MNTVVGNNIDNFDKLEGKKINRITNNAIWGLIDNEAWRELFLLLRGFSITKGEISIENELNKFTYTDYPPLTSKEQVIDIFQGVSSSSCEDMLIDWINRNIYVAFNA